MKKFIAIVLCLAMMISVVAISAFATTETPTAPVLDGVVGQEYTQSRVHWYGTHFCPFDAQLASGATLTDYVAHDDNYIYMAFVCTEDLTQFDIALNAHEDVTDDLDQSGMGTWIFLKLTDEGTDLEEATATFEAVKNSNVPQTKQDALNTLRALNENEIEYCGKRNYDNDVFVNVTIEVKISKAALTEIFNRDSLDDMGFYTQMWKKSTGTKASTTQFLWNIATDYGYESSGNEQYINDYGMDRGTHYPATGRFMNFIIFDDAPASFRVYCDSSEFCYFENHANRSSDMDWTDLSGIGLLPSLYVPAKLGEANIIPAVTEPSATNPPATNPPATNPPATEAPATNPPATEAPATTTVAATTAAPEKGCGKSITLSALAIVPVLGLGVAFTAKKKED